LRRIPRLTLLLVAVVVAAAVPGAAVPATAQQRSRPTFLGAIEWRTQVGSVPDSLDRRTALALRLMADGTLARYAGWRAEGGYIQSRYERRADSVVVPISESGYEVGGYLRLGQQAGRKWLPYVLGGAVVSLRGSCNLDDGFNYDNPVRCGDATTIRLGWGAGAGVRMTGGLAGWDWFAEARVLNNVTSASGGRLFTIGFGAGM
jgi:hypothetical protein